MKIRGAGSRKDDKIELNMTPMIDIVFQLLTFFIMTLRIAAVEGDFSIKMPRVVANQGTPDEREQQPFRLRLTANADGTLKSMRLDERTLRGNISSPEEAAEAFEALREAIIAHVGDARGPGSIAAMTEVELDCDYDLDYENVIAAITAVSGYVSEKDKKSVVKLVERIKFAPPRSGAED